MRALSSRRRNGFCGDLWREGHVFAVSYIVITTGSQEKVSSDRTEIATLIWGRTLRELWETEDDGSARNFAPTGYVDSQQRSLW